MNSHAAAFTTGAAITAAALLYSNLNGPAAAFAAGILVAIVASVGILASRRRLRAIAALLIRIAGPERTTRATAAPAPVSPLEAEVTAALVQLGAKKAAAAAAARQAASKSPAADFNSLFRAALPLCSKTA